MKNLSQGRDVENSLKKTTFELGEADYLATATEERIMLLNSDIAGLNANLYQAEHELDKAESLGVTVLDETAFTRLLAEGPEAFQGPSGEAENAQVHAED